MTTAEQDRAAIIDRVAHAIWEAPAQGDRATAVAWDRAVEHHDSPNGDHAVSERVRMVRLEARAAMEVLIIGSRPYRGAVMMADAGAHVSGLPAPDCADLFNAMLAEALA